MKNIKSWIYAIIYLVLFFSLCKTCISDHIKGASKTNIENFEKMIADNSFVQAELSEKYKEITLKVLKVPIKTYEFDYVFYLSNNSYNGKITLSKLPDNRYISLFYLKENPKIISLDPQNALKNEKEKGRSNANLYWGILFGILGLLILISITAKIFKVIFDKKKVPNQIKSEVIKKPVIAKIGMNVEPRIDKEDHNRFMPI